MEFKGNILSDFVGETTSYLADSGSADNYAVALRPAITAYTAGLKITFQAANANTGTATLAVNGLVAKTIKKSVSTNLSANDILTNQIVTIIYDGTNFQMASGTGGGAGTSGYSGYCGLSGYSGYSSSVPGATGTSGYSGYSGVSGYSGYSGSGLSGYSGYSGSGVSGYSGFSGAGTSGYSGYSGIGRVIANKLTTSKSVSSTSNYTTASITPTANRLVLVAVSSIDPINDAIPTISGNSLTYTLVASQEVNPPTDHTRVTVFQACGVAPSAGAITINFAGNNQNSCAWSVVEFDSVDTSNPTPQNVTNTTVTATSSTVTLASFQNVFNATYGAFAVISNQTLSSGNGFTTLDTQAVSTAHSLLTEWRQDNDTTVDASGSSTSWAGVAIEIKCAGAGTSGYSGFCGLSGYSGYCGLSGYSGFCGLSGYSGFSGRSGYSGYCGLSGYSGYSGAGTSGYSGYCGVSGYSGYSSTSGYSGYSGLSGEPSPGTFEYVYDSSSTAVGDPGAGRCRFVGTANPDLLTEIDFNFTDTNGQSFDGLSTIIGNSPSDGQFVGIMVVTCNTSFQAPMFYRVGGCTGGSFFRLTGLVAEVAESNTYTNGDHLLFSFIPNGVSGYSGFCGQSGYSGFSSSSGYSGFCGLSGYSGFCGLSGYSGFSGKSGYSGFSGLSGYSGFCGLSGYSGFCGISGYSGYSGAGLSGYSGFCGLSGYSGFSAASPGASGYSGFCGLSGYSGFCGTGTSGYSGFCGAGTSGYSGYSGVSLLAYSSTFNATTDWGSASGGLYSLAFAHNLNSANLVVEVWDTTSTPVQVSTEVVERTNANTLTIKVPSSPDSRFAGTVVVNGAGATGTSGYSGYSGISGSIWRGSITVESPGSSENVCFAFTTAARTISKVIAVLKGSSPSVTYNIGYGTDVTSLTNVTTSPSAVTSTTTGTTATLNNTSIPANGYLVFTTSASSGTITWIQVTVEA